MFLQPRQTIKALLLPRALPLLAQLTANPNSLSAAALLGLGSIPWGWIAILIIIILGVSVFYLLFNRHNNKEV